MTYRVMNSDQVHVSNKYVERIIEILFPSWLEKTLK